MAQTNGEVGIGDELYSQSIQIEPHRKNLTIYQNGLFNGAR